MQSQSPNLDQQYNLEGIWLKAICVGHCSLNLSNNPVYQPEVLWRDHSFGLASLIVFFALLLSFSRSLPSLNCFSCAARLRATCLCCHQLIVLLAFDSPGGSSLDPSSSESWASVKPSPDPSAAFAKASASQPLLTTCTWCVDKYAVYCDQDCRK